MTSGKSPYTKGIRIIIIRKPKKMFPFQYVAHVMHPRKFSPWTYKGNAASPDRYDFYYRYYMLRPHHYRTSHVLRHLGFAYGTYVDD